MRRVMRLKPLLAGGKEAGEDKIYGERFEAQSVSACESTTAAIALVGPMRPVTVPQPIRYGRRDNKVQVRLQGQRVLFFLFFDSGHERHFPSFVNG